MTSLRIITNPLKTTYKVGDLLDLGGIRLEYVDERGKISYINASQIQPAEVSGFSTSKVNLNGRMVITKHLLSVVVHYNVEEGRVEPVPPTPPVDPTTIEELLQEILHKMPVSTDTDEVEDLLQEIKNKIPKGTDTDEVESLLKEIKNKIPSSTDTDGVEALLEEIKNKIPHESDQIESLLQEIKEKIPEESDQVEALLLQILNRIPESAPQIEALLRELIDKLPTDFENIENILRNILCTIPIESNKVNQQLQEIKEKIPSGIGQIEVLLQQILENIPKESNEIEDLLREILQKLPVETSSEVESLLRELITSSTEDSEKVQKIMQQILSKLPEQSGEVEQLLQQILEKIPEQSDQVEQLLQDIKETIPKSTSEELIEIQKVLLKILEKISPEDPTPPLPPTDMEISWQDFKTVLQTYVIDPIKDPGAVLLNLNMLKDWIWNNVIPSNLPSEIQELVNGKTLSLSTVITAVLNGVFKMIAGNEEQLHDASFQERATEVLEMLKNLVLGYKFDLATIITFAKKVLHIDQEKRYCAQMGIDYEGIEDIGFDVDWILQMLKSVDVDTFKSYFTLDGLKDLISTNVLKLSELTDMDFLPQLVEAGVAVEEFLETLIKEGRVDASGIANLVMQNLVKMDWIKENADKYGINLEGIQELISNIAKGDFSQITDPEALAKIAQGIFPSPYDEYVVVASDLVRYPEKTIKEQGQKALDWASGQADIYIQKGTDMLMTTLKGTVIGQFLDTVGLTELASTGLQSLAVFAKDTLISGIGSLFGISITVPNPLPYLQELVFEVAPEKVVYYIKENLNLDDLSISAILSDGTISTLTSEFFTISGFDTTSFFEHWEDFKNITFTLKEYMGFQKGFQVPRRLTESEKILLERNGNQKKVIRNFYGKIIASENNVGELVFPYKVFALVPISFEIISAPDKTSYILGETFDKSGLKGLVTYNDNQTTQVVDENNLVVVGFKNDTIGSFQAYVYYQKFYATVSYTIKESTPVNIYLERTPDAPCFYVGDKINVNGISVCAQYEGINEMLPVPAKYLTIPDITFTEKSESYEVVVSYKGFHVSYNVQVVDYSLIFFEVLAEPLLKSYVSGERVSLDGMILAGIQMDTTVVQLNEEDDEYLLAFYHPQVTPPESTRYHSKTKKELPIFNQIIKLQEGDQTNPDPVTAYSHMKSTGEPYQDDYWYYMTSSMLNKYDFYTSGTPGTYVVYAYTWEKIRDPNRKSTPDSGNWGSLLQTKFTYLLKEEPPNFYGYFVAPSSSMKERYISGDTIDLQGLVVEARYGKLLPDGTYSISERHILDKTNFSYQYYYIDDPKTYYDLSKPLKLETGKSSDNIVLEGQFKSKPENPSVTWKILLRDAHIIGIEINKQNPKIKYTYFYGEIFDPSILEVYIQYSDGYLESLDLNKCTITGIDTSKIKKQKVIVSYMSFSDNYTISIEKGSLNCISVRREPTKMIYYVGENFNTRGLELYAIYDTGYEEKIALSDTNLHIVGFYSLRAQKNIHVYILYKGKRAVINPSIVEREVSYITFEAPPNKVFYQVKDIASWDGLIVLAHMEDGRSTVIPLSDLTILGFDSTEPYGKIEIVAQYIGFENSFSVSFHVFILPGPLSNVYIENYPSKRDYGLYESLDLTGLITKGYCENNPRMFEIPSDVFTITNFDTSTLTGYSDTGEENIRYYYLSLPNQNIAEPISIPYKVRGDNLQQITIVPPTCQFIPIEALQDPKVEGDHYYIDKKDIPSVGGSVVEHYIIDNNPVTKSIDLSYVLNAPSSEWEVSCISVGDDPSSQSTDQVRYISLEVSKIINEIPIRTAYLKFMVLLNMGIFATSYSEVDGIKNTPNIILVGNTPSCQYVNWEYTYRDSSGQSNTDVAFENLEGISQSNALTFDQLGVVRVNPDTTYEHYDKVSFISPTTEKDTEDPDYGKRKTYSFTVKVINPYSKPKAVDILDLPNKLTYNLDDQVIDLTGINIVQVYEDQTSYPIDIEDLSVVSFNTESEGQQKVIFSALNGEITMVYDIEVLAVPNALFINCYPNQLIYYNYTFTNPSLEGIEVQAQFRDTQSGYIWNQDIDVSELNIESFSTSNILESELKNGEKSVKRLCSLSWRGARTFFEYEVLVEEPVDVEIPVGEDGFIIKKQNRISKQYPKVHLKDVIVSYIYPDKSIQQKDLESVLGTMGIGLIEYQINQLSDKEEVFIYTFSILDKKYSLQYNVIIGGVYAINCFPNTGESIIQNELYGTNSIEYNFNFEVTIYYEDGYSEIENITDMNVFEVKKDFLRIGTKVIEPEDIIYIKDGYYVQYTENTKISTSVHFTYKGLQMIGILYGNVLESRVIGISDPTSLEIEENHWILPNDFEMEIIPQQENMENKK